MKKLIIMALCFLPIARADTYHISGATYQPACQFVSSGTNCPSVEYSLIAEAQTYAPTDYLLITSLIGQINGQSIAVDGPDGFLNAGLFAQFSGVITSHGPIPFGPGIPDYLLPAGGPEVRFMLNGQQGIFCLDDFFTDTVFMATGNSITYVTWNAVTPEPSVLILLALPCIVLLGIYYGTRIYNWHSPLEDVF